MQAKAIEVDQGLPIFYKAIKLSQANEIIAEYNNMTEHFSLKFNDYNTMSFLRTNEVPKVPMVGTPWYRVLSNSEYCNDFMYLGAHLEDRHNLIEDGTMDKYDENG